ncbi:hypothetical protein P2318_16210 [Myxococcaceae bacterium GXIMD 01537]
MKRFVVPLMLCVAVAALCVTVARLFASLPNYAFLMPSHTSGTWATLAHDLAHGVFYRPIVSDTGGIYGGTRYFPLHFVLHAALIRVLGGVWASGHVIGVAAVAALIVGMYRVLRQFGVGTSIAAACSVLVLATAPVQTALTRVGSDSLSAAFAMWGLSFCVSQAAPMNRRRILAAVAFFSLAFFTKQTCLSALAAAVLALGLTGQRRAALTLAGLTGLVLVGGVFLLDVLTQHRFLEAGTLGAGEVSTQSLFAGPVRFLKFVVFSDPAGLLFFLLSLGLLVVRAKVLWKEPPTLLLLITIANLMILFGQPGTEPNHLLELGAALLVFIGAQLGRERLSLSFGGGYVAFASTVGLVLISVFMFFKPPWQEERIDHRKALADLFSAAGPAGPRPMLSENPWVPLLNDETPIVIDPIAARMIPFVHQQLLERIASREFRAIVLQQDPVSNREWYETTHFGPGFVERLLAHYESAGEFGLNRLYLPKPSATPEGGAVQR